MSHSRYRWVALSVGVVAQAALGATLAGIPAISPAIRAEFQLTLSEIGVVVAAVSAGMVVTVLPWGLAVDRVGERVAVAVGLVGAAVALVIAARASTPTAFALALAGSGLCGAATIAGTGTAVMRWFAVEERGVAMGIRQIAIPAGGAAAGLTVPHLARGGGVSAALLGLAAACAVAALASAVGLRDAAQPTRVPAAESTPPSPLRDRGLWRLSAATGLLVSGQATLLAFGVLLLHEEHGLAAATAATFFAAVSLAGAVVRVGVGRLSDRSIGRVRLLRILAGVNVAALAVLVGTAEMRALVFVPVFAVAMLVVLSWNGLAFTAAAERGRGRSGTALGLQTTVVAGCAAVAPMLFGVIVDATSWRAGLLIMAAGAGGSWWALGTLAAEEDRATTRSQRAARARSPGRPAVEADRTP